MVKSRKERKEWIAFTVSKEEKEIIVDKARKEDQSISDFCRKTLTKNSNEEGFDYVRKDTRRA